MLSAQKCIDIKNEINSIEKIVAEKEKYNKVIRNRIGPLIPITAVFYIKSASGRSVEDSSDMKWSLDHFLFLLIATNYETKMCKSTSTEKTINRGIEIPPSMGATTHKAENVINGVRQRLKQEYKIRRGFRGYRRCNTWFLRLNFQFLKW